jgi:hypothetical protein
MTEKPHVFAKVPFVDRPCAGDEAHLLYLPALALYHRTDSAPEGGVLVLGCTFGRSTGFRLYFYWFSAVLLVVLLVVGCTYWFSAVLLAVLTGSRLYLAVLTGSRLYFCTGCTYWFSAVLLVVLLVLGDPL